MEAYLAVTLKEIKHLNPGEKFTLQDLLKNYEWESLGVVKHRILERMFLRAVESGEAKGVVILQKSENGEQVYKKE